MNTKSIINNLGSYISIILALGYTIGLIKIYVYYQCFDFNILPFLDFSDLLTQTFNNIMYVLEFGLVTITIISAYTAFNPNRDFKQLTEKDYKFEEPKENKSVEDDGFLPKSKWKRTLFILALLVCEIDTIYETSNHFFTLINFYVTILSICFALIFFGTVFLYIKIRREKEKSKIQLALFTFLAIVTIMYTQIIDANFKKYSLPVGSKFYTSTDSIITSKRLIYIGATTKYLFLYQIPNQAVEIYPMIEIKRLIIKN